MQLASEKLQASRARVPLLLIHSQSVVYLEGQTCTLPCIAALANGFSARTMPGSCRLGGGGAGSSSIGIFHASQHATRCFFRCQQVPLGSNVLPQD